MELRNYTKEQTQTIQAAFMSKVYTWMSGGLAITGLIAMWVASNESLVYTIVTNKLLFYGLVIGEIFLVGYLISMINRLSAQTAGIIFTGYAVLNGITLSLVFLAYTSASIATTFFVTAGTFAIMSIYGYYTKKDLTSWGNLLFMGLIGVILASVVNLFMQSEMLYWIVTYVGVFVFIGLIAYDTQKIKAMSTASEIGSEAESKGAIVGALMLYLDFINLFLLLLRFFGDRR